MGSSKDMIGLELDLHSIAHMPTEELSPSGISLEEAAFYVHAMSSSLPIVYAHFPEGAPSLVDCGEKIVGQGLSLLVSTFIKGCEHCGRSRFA